MKILILDDDKSRLSKFRKALIGHNVTTVEYVGECIKELKENGPFQRLFLDHDLSGKVFVPSGPGTGYEVAEWLSKNPEFMPEKIIIHSYNQDGAQRMMKVLNFKAVYIPGAWETGAI